MSKTLFDKIWDLHVVEELGEGVQLMFVDRHLIHELSGYRGQVEIAGRGLKMRKAAKHVKAWVVPGSWRIKQNDLLPIVLPQADVDALAKDAEAGKSFEIDLVRQTINGATRFELSPRRKKMLLEGLDEIDLTMALEPKIAAFEAADRARRPWIYPA